MASLRHGRSFLWAALVLFMFMFMLVGTNGGGANIFHEWRVALNTTIQPVSSDQPVITINGMFPGPLINSTTNDNIYVNIFNDLDEPLLMTWNGIQQRRDSWQDGVSGTNCPIQPGKNWTYVFQMKDQIGSYFYFPSINFQKAGGGFGPIRVNNRIVIKVPFAEPHHDFDLLIGDWYHKSFKEVRSNVSGGDRPPQWMLMNGKGPFGNPLSKAHESFTVSKGKTYRFRISNVGTTWSFNFRIQNHTMQLVEAEGSYTNKMIIESLDVHIGQSYSVLVTADQDSFVDYYMVASPKMANESFNSNNTLVGVGVLHYEASENPPTGPLPAGPDPFDLQFSLNQSQSIRWNLTTGAARPNPQGAFNVSNVTLSQTFILNGSFTKINGISLFTVNNVSYDSPNTPLKLADEFLDDSSGVFQLDAFPINSTLSTVVNGTFVSSGIHRGWLEIVFMNRHDSINSWHLDGFGFFVVGFGHGDWEPIFRYSYNLYDPIVRSTVEVYPRSWTAVYAYLDNPGMWNLRSQILRNWYLGQELYVRVFDTDLDPAKERPPPENLLYCGLVQAPISTPPAISPIPKPTLASSAPPALPPPMKSTAETLQIEIWFLVTMGVLIMLL